nr:MAG TPA: hypothetical protein [Caudoviricetes sp.]
MLTRRNHIYLTVYVYTRVRVWYGDPLRGRSPIHTRPRTPRTSRKKGANRK